MEIHPGLYGTLWISMVNVRSARGPRRISTQARLHEIAGAQGQGRAREKGQETGAVFLRAEASGESSPLRLPARAQWHAAVLGRAEGSGARSDNQAAGDA